MAPNTAMLRSTLPMKVPAASPPRANHTTSITAKPITPPVMRAVFGVLCSPWVTDRKCGK